MVGNPSHFGMRGREEVRLGIRWSQIVVLERRGEGCWWGGMEASLRGFHVEEIHLLELIKI